MKPVVISARSAAALALLFLAGGCASVQHRVLGSEDADNKNTSGIRYYQSAPYVLVYKDDKGAYVWKLYYLPDQTRLMVAEPQQLLAKITSNMTFNNGVLTEANSDVDATAVAKAVVKSIGTLAAAGVLDSNNKLIEGDGPWFWRLEVERGEIKFLRADDANSK